jgi:hypothetical protein
MVNLYPCVFCEAVFVDPVHAKDHIRDCHSKNWIIPTAICPDDGYLNSGSQ